jgi:signal transduction histidine kinase
MWKRISLRTRIFALLAALVAATLGGGLVTSWYFSRVEGLFSTIIDRNIAALEAASGLQAALVMQKGYVTYYFLYGEQEWLEELDKYHQAFREWLLKAERSAYLEEAAHILDQIESQYARFVASREQVLDLYRIGRRDEGALLHRNVRGQFLSIYDLCEQYKSIHERSIHQTQEANRREIRLVSRMALVVVPSVVLIGILLSYILLRQVLGPIRKLAIEAGPASDGRAGISNEVNVLTHRVQSLIEDVDRTHTKLKLSRGRLMQSEKLAMVGKLAAGVAHSIRNPLTSVKMRLFSLERTLVLSENQKEDFDVISEEIRHIDNIVRNFLEFSRRPKLKVQKVSPSKAVDMALQLLRHRIESYGVDVELDRREPLPEIMADPEQLKEVFVNILVNACEALSDGGRIVIREEEGTTDSLDKAAVIRVSDNGRGIPESVQDKLFQPFFSTKEEGTGLGLSIAMRIVEDHGGMIGLESREGQGATFIITLPVREGQHIG